jgi:hypothetical protein
MNVEARECPKPHTALDSAVSRPILGLSWPLLLGITALLLQVGLVWGLRDPDPYWQVVVGEWMLDHHRIPTWDLFSYTMPGAPATTQEWGAEIIVALVYRAAAWSGLLLLAAAVFASTMAYLARFLLRRLEPLHAVTLTCLSGAMMFPLSMARPHAIVWPLVALWAAKLVEAAEARRSPQWWLLVVMCLWANLHGSFMLGLALVIPLALESVLSARRIASPAVYRALVIRWATFFVAALLCTLVNPVGYHALLFPFHMVAMKSVLALITEWRSPDFEQPQVLAIWLLALLALAFSGRFRLPWVRSVLLLGLLYMALQHQRNIPLLALISPFILAGPLAAQYKPAATDNALDRVFRALARPAGWWMTCVGVIGSCIVAALIVSAKHPTPSQYAPQYSPIRAVDALMASGSRGSVLNDYNFGGYLIFRGIPVFIDSRADMYGEEFVIKTLETVWLSRPGFEVLLDKYHIQSTLLPTEAAANALLDRLPGWRRLYADDIAVVHVRDDRVTARR